jgi:hypothetical protein
VNIAFANTQPRCLAIDEPSLFVFNFDKTDLRFAPVQDFERKGARNIVSLVFNNALIAYKTVTAMLQLTHVAFHGETEAATLLFRSKGRSIIHRAYEITANILW